MQPRYPRELRCKARRRLRSSDHEVRRRFRMVLCEPLEDRLPLAADWQNPYVTRDVTGDGIVVPQDALVAINELNAMTLVLGMGKLPSRDAHPEAPFYDVSGDGNLVPQDVLIIINALNQDDAGPTIISRLVNDTAPNGTTNGDGLTSDGTITGNTEDILGVATLFVQVDNGNSQRITIERDGTFRFVPELLRDGSADGPHTLRIKATDPKNQASVFDVNFVLDTAAPSSPDFDLTPSSDSGELGDQQTAFGRVTFIGTTEPKLDLQLVQSGVTALASNQGTFFVPNVHLPEVSNRITIQVHDAAGNRSETTRTFTRLVAGAATDPVIEWNQQTLEAIRIDATTPPQAARALAIVHSAILDTVNAIDGTPGQYVSLPSQPGTSAVAAIAAAAHRALSHEFHAQQSALDAKLADSLAQIPAGPGKTDGIALGRAMADAILALRENDGYQDFEEYFGGMDAGDWQPTAPMFGSALLPPWGNVQTFLVSDVNSLLPPGPPELSSLEWTTAFEEVKSLGAANSAARTPEQTAIAKFWADGKGTYTPPGHWNQIAEIVSQAHGASLADNARLFAQLNVGLADAAIATWKVKYSTGFWRPITAIQRADSDGNDQTTADPTWSPLLITPPFPEYVSGHSAFSGAAATILSDIFGNDVAFTVGSFTPANLVRSFSSFDAAASEAALSRILGGIHYRFSGEDGLTLGRSIGQQVLAAFSSSHDTQPPTIVLDQLPTATAQNIDLRGQILDNLAGLQIASLQIDDGEFTPLSLDSIGRFTLTTSLPTDGTADGQHVYRFRASDAAGNSTIRELAFTLDTRAPVVSITSLSNNAALDDTSRLAGTTDGTGSAIVRLSYAFDGGIEMPFGWSVAGTFDSRLDISRLSVGAHTLLATALDAAGNSSQTSLQLSLPIPAHFTVASMFPAAGSEDVGSTFRPQVFFSRPVDPSSLNTNNFYATDTAGAKLPATIVPSRDGSFAWLFFANPMPGGSQITLHVQGATIFAAADGVPLDADRNGTAGGLFETTFWTVSLAPLLGTSLSGKVVDPGPDLAPMTFDDLRPGADGILHTADDVFLRPLTGVKVFLLGMEDQAVLTDAAGNFRFDAVPGGNVKLALDGRTATNSPVGYYFPEMVMDLNLRAGQANTAMGTMGTLEQQLANVDRGEVYLPRLRIDLLQSLSATEPTVVTVDPESATGLTPEQRSRLTITVDPGSLIGHEGQAIAGGEIGISTVPPELVRDMLPAGLLQHTFDITIQAPGIDRFTTPAPMTFPNVFHAAPGSQLNLLSFDHTTGRLVIEGTATVSADGLTASTDPGTGITHPGWHGLTPPGTQSSFPCKPSQMPPVDVEPILVTSGLRDYFFKDDEGQFVLSFGNAAQPLFPGIDLCDPSNAAATPLHVKITLESPGSVFLEGLASQEFSLLPGQQKSIKVQVIDWLGHIQNVDEDQFIGAYVRIEARQDGQPALLLDKKLYISRFLDAADTIHDDGVVEFIDTVNDGSAVITRRRAVQFSGPVPDLQVLDVNFGLTGTPDVTDGLFFDPETTGPNITTTLFVRTPEGNPIPEGTLVLKGEGTPRLRININKLGLDLVLAKLAAGTEPTSVVESVLLTPTERELFNTPTERAAIIDAVANKVAAYYADVSQGIVVDDFGPGVNAIHVSWKNLATWGSFGQSAPGGGVDKLTDIQSISANYKKWNAAEGAFRLAKAVNQVDPSIVEVYVDNHLEWATGADASTPTTLRHPLDLTSEQFVNVLAFNVAHEVGHTLGLIHSAQGQASSVTSGEQQRINLIGGNSTSTFHLTFENADTQEIPWKATAKVVEMELQNIASLLSLTPNVTVTGSDGGPYIVTFGGLLLGTDVPLLKATGTNGLSPLVITILEASSPPEFQLEPGTTTPRELTIGTVRGRDDVMYGGNLDLDGNSTFQSKLTLELLRMGLKIDFTPEDAALALNYVVARYVIGDFSGLGVSDGGEISRPPGSFLAVRDSDDQLIFDEINFGTVAVDGAAGAEVTMPIQLFSYGTENVVLRSARVLDSLGQFLANADISETILHPGEELALSLSFDPLRSGDGTATLVIDTDDVATRTEIVLTGFGLASAGALRIDAVNNNLGGAKTLAGAVLGADAFTLRNIGAGPLSITDIHFAAGSEFAIGGVPVGFGPSQPLVIGPGGSFALDVSFDPSAIGLRRAALEIISDDAEAPVVRQTFIGTGLADTGSALDYGNDFVALETHLLPGAPVLRQRSDEGGNWSFFLPSNEAIHNVIFDPVSGLISDAYDVTSGGFGATLVPTPFFLASTAHDTDGDGLPDDVEFAIGTGRNDIDTDHDGLSDFAEIAQGLDPLGGLGLPTGVVAAAALRGEAHELVVEGSLTDSTAQTAYVATGNYGLAIVDLTLPTTPIVLSELNLTGVSTDVGFDPARNLAVLAAGPAGVHIVDVSNPFLPTLVKTVEVEGGASSVKLFDGLAYVTAVNAIFAIDLVTHQVRQTLQLSQQTLTSLAMEGNTLYALDAGENLRAITLDGLQMVPRDSVIVPGSTGHVFVGNGIAYVPVSGSGPTGLLFGFATADVRDPDNLTLISGSDMPPGVESPRKAFAATGSGVGLLVGDVIPLPMVRLNALDVMVVADPANTAAFVTRVLLPGLPRGVAIASGLSFIADDSSGLQVVSFQPLDTQGQAPTVSILTSAVDDDPATPGIQVREGRSIQVLAEVTDDVLVRNVELLVDNQVVQNDVSFPWGLLATAPIVNQPVTLTIQVRATDTGGNAVLSNLLSIDVIPDLTPPTLLDTTPDEGQELLGLAAIDLYFDDGLDEDVLDSARMTLTNLGGNNLPGGGDDTTVAIGELVLRDQGRILTIVPATELVAGVHRLTVDTAILADPAGNHVVAPIELNFSLRPLRFNIRADSGTPALSQVSSANPGQEISFIMPWGPEAARISFPTIGINGVRPTVPERLEPSRTDPITRTAYFIVPDDAITGDITVFGGGTDGLSDLPNWTVVGGSVDVVGQDVTGFSTQDNLPGNGLYLDLGSSNDDSSSLESKTPFDLVPGDYELRFDLAGSRNVSSQTVTVSLGDEFLEVFARPSRSPFATIIRTITVTDSSAARLVFDHTNATIFGLHLDNVKLTRVDSGAVLLDDHFDLPFPDGIVPLQIVPVLTNVDVTAAASDGSNVVLSLFGAGFIEGENTSYQFGSVEVVDTSASAGPDVTAANGSATLALSLSQAAFGPISITTAGGRSAPFTVGVSTITGTALSGTPADPAVPSANPGQSITINGTGLASSTDIVVTYTDEMGVLKTLLLNPTLTDLDGTSAQIILPTTVSGVVPIGVLGSPTALSVQIVPVIEQGVVVFRPQPEGPFTRLSGRGFVEGDTEYDVDGIVYFDAGVADGAMDVLGSNATVELNFAISADALVQVTTPGGTSTPIRVNVSAPPELPAPIITGISTVAADGVPTNPASSSGNTGQVITIQGANFRLGSLQILFPTRDESGLDGSEGVPPLAVNDAGTLAEVRVPDMAATGPLRVATIGSRNLGFGNANDAIHRGIEIEFTPAGGTVVLRFADGGLQGLSEESWGLDNVRVERETTAVFSDDFQGAARPEWSVATTAETTLLSRFSGPFSASVQTLTLTGLTAGMPHTLRFDLYVLDSWDGMDATQGPDQFLVLADGETLFDEAFSNDPEKSQTFARAEGVLLQVVPTISRVTAGNDQAFNYDLGVDILGSGFMEGAGTITIGGLNIHDHFGGELLLEPNVVAGSGNKRYEIGPTPFTLDGPIRVTTAGGYFEGPGAVIRPPASVSLHRIETTAEDGIPLDPNLPSANTGQVLTLHGSFNRTEDVLFQFDAVDDTGKAGTITSIGQRGSSDRHGRLMTVVVPESARTGMVRAVGSPGEFFLQIVPTLRSFGPVISGVETVVEGTGLFQGDLSLSVDGQPVNSFAVQTVRTSGRQFVTFTVPAGIGPGKVTAVTSGGTATLRPGVAQSETPVTPIGDVGDTIGAALALTTVINGRVMIDSDLQPRPDPAGDIDIYQFNFQAGEQIVFDLAATFSSGDASSGVMRLFNSAGQELAFDRQLPDDYEPPATSEERLEFTAPIAGVYFLGVSDDFHASYNPLTGEQFPPDEPPEEGYPTGPYQLYIRRLAADATVLTGMTAIADRGAPAHAGVASANTGQLITLTGSGLRAGELVVFVGATGVEKVVAPLVVSADGSSLTVRVPDPGNVTHTAAEAASGIVRLSAEAVGLFLQIVPTLDDLQVSRTLTLGERSAEVSGTGLDLPASIHFGSVGFEVRSHFNDTIGLNHTGVPLGPALITTPGGTSAPLTGPDLVSVVALATSGVPANSSLPSANPGQTITIQGSQFKAFERFVSLATPLVFQTIDAAGIRRERIVDPTTVDPAGVQMTVVVPDDAVTGPIGVVGDPQGTTVLLQIVPLLTSVMPAVPGSVQVVGKGLIEGGALYRFGASEVLDGSVSDAGVDVVGTNDTAHVALSVLGSGSLTVTTAGGTSAPFPFGALRSSLPGPAPGESSVNGAAANELTPRMLKAYVAEALTRFATAGASSERLRGAQTIAWQIGDLPGNYLGLFANNIIVIDRNAAGWGWFIDPASADDSEYTTPGNPNEQDRMDLLTVVMHELGHAVGLAHDESGVDLGGVMSSTLVPGVRRPIPWSSIVDAFFAQEDDLIDVRRM